LPLGGLFYLQINRLFKLHLIEVAGMGTLRPRKSPDVRIGEFSGSNLGAEIDNRGEGFITQFSVVQIDSISSSVIEAQMISIYPK
jgi:hypothetical protein